MGKTNLESFQQVLDRLENIEQGTFRLPLPDAIHIEALRSLIPEIAQDLREAIKKAEEDDNI